MELGAKGKTIRAFCGMRGFIWRTKYGLIVVVVECYLAYQYGSPLTLTDIQTRLKDHKRRCPSIKANYNDSCFQLFLIVCAKKHPLTSPLRLATLLSFDGSVAVLAENRKSTPEVNFFFLEKRLYQKETFMARNHLKFIKATKEIPPTSSDAALTQVSSKISCDYP